MDLKNMKSPRYIGGLTIVVENEEELFTRAKQYKIEEKVALRLGTIRAKLVSRNYDLSDIHKYLNNQIVLKKQENAFIKDLIVFQNEEYMALNAPLAKEIRFNHECDKYLVSFIKTKYVSGFSISRTLGRNGEEDEFDAQDAAKEEHRKKLLRDLSLIPPENSPFRRNVFEPHTIINDGEEI